MSRNNREDRYAHAGHVSPELVGYEDLGAYGTWHAEPDYVEVWVPNSVPGGWAPYHDGHWAWIDPWGWTWVDDEPLGVRTVSLRPLGVREWLLGLVSGPMGVAPVYAPALVAWVGFAGGPEVGWFPLGPRDVYIPVFPASTAFVTRLNVTNTTVINSAHVTNVYRAISGTELSPSRAT